MSLQISSIKSIWGSRNKFAKMYLGRTARFWISFMDNAELVFMLIYAVKANNRKLFHKCNGEIAKLSLRYIEEITTWFTFISVPGILLTF